MRCHLTMPVQRRFRRIEGGATPDDRVDDLRAVIDDYLRPALDGLEQAIAEGDLTAARAYAYEVIVGAGSVVSACPRPIPEDTPRRPRHR